MRRWIGFDSSIASFGFAVMRSNPEHHVATPVLECIGTITTKIDPDAPKLADRARRVMDIAKNITALLSKNQIDVAFIESLALGMKTSRSTAQTLGRVRGLVEGLCCARGIPLIEIRPEMIKLAITGNKGASKEDVARVLAHRFYPMPVVFEANTDETDAIAVAHVGWARHLGVAVSSGVVRFRQDDGDDLGF